MTFLRPLQIWMLIFLGARSMLMLTRHMPNTLKAASPSTEHWPVSLLFQVPHLYLFLPLRWVAAWDLRHRENINSQWLRCPRTLSIRLKKLRNGKSYPMGQQHPARKRMERRTEGMEQAIITIWKKMVGSLWNVGSNTEVTTFFPSFTGNNSNTSPEEISVFSGDENHKVWAGKQIVVKIFF